MARNILNQFYLCNQHYWCSSWRFRQIWNAKTKLAVSDNGPSSPSEELIVFPRKNGVFHPNSNGQVKRYGRTFKEAMDTDSETPIRTRISKFLFSRRALHTYTSYSSAELMLPSTSRLDIDMVWSQIWAVWYRSSYFSLL